MSNRFKFWIDPYGSIKGANVFQSGTPILVVLDPFDTSPYQDDEIDFSTVDESFHSIKMWIMNRIFIYVSEDGNSWERNFGSFEGILSEPFVKVNPKGEEFRQPIFKKTTQKYHIYFTTLPPKPNKENSRCSNLKVKIPLEIKKPEDDMIKRPYPEDSWDEAEKKYEKEKIYILRIPSKKIQYKEDTKKLSPWESVIYQYSGGFRKYRQLEKSGELLSDSFEELRAEIRKRLHKDPLATLKKEKSGNKTVVDPLHFDLDGDIDCFAYGMTSDVAKEMGEEMPQDLENEFRLYKLNVKTKSTDELFNRFDAQSEITLQRYANQHMRKKSNEKEIIDLVRKFLYSNSKYTKTEADSLLKNFHLASGNSLEECLMFTLSNALEVWRLTLSSYHLDLLTDKKFSRSYILSAKSVSFGTGSDAFSEGETPRHIYFQLKNWWDSMFKYQRDEIQREIGEIRVVGYSSAKTSDEKDNPRLRKDRAWKTAVALEAVLTDGGIERFGINPDPPKEELQYEKDFKGRVRSIHFEAAEENKYPNRHLFREIGTFVQDIVLTSDIEEREIRGNQYDDAKHRVSLIIFKKPIPKEVDQIVKQIIVTNSAFPISRYTKIYEWPFKGGMKRALFYICPGQFVQGPP